MSGDRWPLFGRFPALASIPHVELRAGPTPIESVSPTLWIKRDDLTASPIGGNKVRSLEFLLGGVTACDRVATVGSRGSTHALAATAHAKALGARISIGSWPQEMNSVAGLVAARLDREANERHQFGNVLFALAWLQWRQLRGDRVIPAGGTSALGILGHVNAALEVARQIELGAMPLPARVVVPLGTGGTAAGLALGFGLAGIRTTIVGARVVPKIVGRRGRVVRLAREAAKLIGRVTGEPVDHSAMGDVVITDGVYGGAYGRPLERAASIAHRLDDHGVTLDPTYAAKAFVAATEYPDGPTLFWLTFDARWLPPSSDSDVRADFRY